MKYPKIKEAEWNASIRLSEQTIIHVDKDGLVEKSEKIPVEIAEVVGRLTTKYQSQYLYYTTFYKLPLRIQAEEISKINAEYHNNRAKEIAIEVLENRRLGYERLMQGDKHSAENSEKVAQYKLQLAANNAEILEQATNYINAVVERVPECYSFNWTRYILTL